MDPSPSNPVLLQLPRAQEAYLRTIAQWADVDTTDALLRANTAIQEAISKGRLITAVHGLDLHTAEKASIELGQLGYSTTTAATGQEQQEDGSLKMNFGISICWLNLPANTRDAYTV